MSWCRSAAPAAVLKSCRYLQVHGESGVACCCVQVDSVTLSIYCTASKRWRRNRRERKRKSSFHFSIFFDLPDHQLHASSGILAGVVPFHWGQKDKDSSYVPCCTGLLAAQSPEEAFPRAGPARHGRPRCSLPFATAGTGASVIAVNYRCIWKWKSFH